MSLDTTLARIAALEAALRPPTPTAGGTPGSGAGGSATAKEGSSLSSSSPSAFSRALGQASLGTSTAPLGVASTSPLLGAAPLPGASGATGAASAMVAAARTQVGQAEMPPGSNESPRIAEYRGAVQGAVVGPWCADFVSWSAAQAGAPLGEAGEGFQSVGALWEWAQRSGRAIPAISGTPQAGDLIVWGAEHVGIVESVEPDGTIHTIEGNSENQVAQRTYPPGGSGATGYVRVG